MAPVYKGQFPNPTELVTDLFGTKRSPVVRFVPERRRGRVIAQHPVYDRTCPHQPSCLSPGGTKCLLLQSLGWKNSEEKL